jgi:hypothetical protein
MLLVENHIEELNKEIHLLRQEIVNHKVYKMINDVTDVKIFMQYHVFAVWDFMSLLKALQNNLTCTSIPWFPKGDANTRYLINEIVVGEESDVDQDGIRKSHFELYLNAMQQCGASKSQIILFTDDLKNLKDLKSSLVFAGVAKEARDFVEFTFKIINSQKAHLQAAIFTFGREDLIPDMFMSIVKDLDEKFPNQISIFKYYLERHIEVDGSHHSKLAIEMTESLCETDEQWLEATEAVKEGLQLRINLWNAVYEQIMLKVKSS